MSTFISTTTTKPFRPPQVSNRLTDGVSGGVEVDESDGGRVSSRVSHLVGLSFRLAVCFDALLRVSMYLCLEELHQAGCYLSAALILVFSPAGLFFSSRLCSPFGGTPPPRRPGLSD